MEGNYVDKRLQVSDQRSQRSQKITAIDFHVYPERNFSLGNNTKVNIQIFSRFNCKCRREPYAVLKIRLVRLFCLKSLPGNFWSSSCHQNKTKTKCCDASITGPAHVQFQNSSFSKNSENQQHRRLTRLKREIIRSKTFGQNYSGKIEKISSAGLS